MESKKNPKADLTKKSLLFFQIGLIVMLFLAWNVVEWRTYEASPGDTAMVVVGEDFIEDIPITTRLTPPPPPPPPPVIDDDFVPEDDDSDKYETDFGDTEVEPDDTIYDIDDIPDVPNEEPDDVIYDLVEVVPVFPGCESRNSNNARKQCMSEKIQKYVQRKFNTDLAGELGLEGRQRITVQFKIDSKGNVVDIRARAPHPELEKEAFMVVSSLPKMTPGKQQGKPVGVLYSLPIIFQVE